VSDKMREAFKVAFRKAASEDVDYDEAVDRGLAAALTAQAEQRGDVSGWYCAHCQHGVDPVDVTFGETHVYCGYPVTDCPAPPAPAVPDAKEYEGRDVWCRAYVGGWNDCRDAMLAAAPEVVAKGVDRG